MRYSSLCRVCLISLAVVAFAFRVYQIDARPMHHDEANQAVKFGELLESGYYRYNPDEHHGPTLYYLTLPFAWLASGPVFADLSEDTLRMVPAFFGAAFILLLLLVVDGLGWPAVIAGGALSAVSPCMFYYNRFFIQETLLVFFTFGAIAGGWRYLKRPSIGSAALTGMFIGLMHATKETCVIAYGAIFLAALVTWLSVRGKKEESKSSIFSENLKWHFLALFGSALVISILFFSSFLTNWQGPVDSIMAYLTYFERAGGDRPAHIDNPWYYYFQVLVFGGIPRFKISTEIIILALAVIGFISCFVKKWLKGADVALVRFLAIYTVLMMMIYTAIPYKTPWNMLSFFSGIIILSGIGVSVLFNLFRAVYLRVILVLLLLSGALVLARHAKAAATRFGADSRNPYAYVHTSRDFLNLSKRLEDLARIHPYGKNMLIAVVSSAEDVWPLPWYLRDFSNVGYWENANIVPSVVNPKIVIVPRKRDYDIGPIFGASYQEELFGLRPNVLITLYIERDLWNAFLETRK